MKLIKTSYFFIALLFLSAVNSLSQTSVSGKVIDNEGYPVEYASVYFSDRQVFTSTDEEGFYKIACSVCKADSVVVESLGFGTISIPYQKGRTQVLNFTLVEETLELEEVIIERRENPAFRIMRNVIANKSKNDIRALDAYEYESYNKIELDINNISEEFMEKKILSKLNTSLQELQKLKDDQGRQYFPVFISETLSDYYYKKKPKSTKEIVKATKATGIGMTDGSFTSQLVGASFTQFNFYENSLTILEKEIMSPITDGWRLFYNYTLLDSLNINDRESYELKVAPKNPNQVAFTGKLWIDKRSFALLKMDVVIPKEANLNYIEQIEVTREWSPTEAGPFFPRRTDITIDASDINEKWASMMVRSTFTVDKLILNAPRETKFYEFPVEVNEDAQNDDQAFWLANRHDSLSTHEADAFALVDTINNLPIVRSYVDIFNVVVNGYKSLGKVEIGPYISSYAYNNIEKHRVRLGFKTNIGLSKKMFFKGYLAYGTGDDVLKHNLEGKFILKRQPYVETGFKWRKDLDQLGLESISENNVFESFTKWGTLRSPYYNHQGEIYLFKQLNKHLGSQVLLRNRLLDPVFNFGYFPSGSAEALRTLRTTEAEFKLRFALDEVFLTTDYGRQSLGSTRPEVEFKYTAAIREVFNGGFDYHKLEAQIDHRKGFGVIGRGVMRLKVNKVIGDVPFPLLTNHLGNESFAYIYSGFNLMNFSEFVSDKSIEAKYVHHFEGFFLDRIPLLKKLKWRSVSNVSALWGDVSQRNFDILEPESRVFGTFDHRPYLEVGYGVENIFRIVRVQLFQRLTYLERPDVNKFGIKATLQFAL